MTRGLVIALAAAGSLGLLLGAFAFQHIGGMAPCPLCIWQRWPHVAAMAAAIGAWVMPAIVWPLAGAGAMLVSAGLGGYHTGIERGWWAGPDSCAGGGSLSGLSGSELLGMDGPSGVVLCDEVVWEMLGLSMASWNAAASLGLAALWLAALSRIGQRGAP